MPKRMMSTEEAKLNQLSIAFCSKMVKAIFDAGKQNVEGGQDLLKKMNKELETLVEHQTEHENCTSEFLGEIKKMAEHSAANLTSKVLSNSFDENLISRRINEYKEELESLVASSDAAENNYFAVQENISLLKNKVMDLAVTMQQEEEFIHAQEEAAAKAERERQRQEEEAERQRMEEKETERQRQEEEAEYERQRKAKAERDRKRRAKERDLERQRKAEEKAEIDRKRRAEERDMERKRKADEKVENDSQRRAEAHRDCQRKSKAVTPSMEDLMLMPMYSPTPKKTPTPTPSINIATTPKKYSTPFANKMATPLNKVSTPSANKTTPAKTTPLANKTIPAKTTPLANKIAIVPPIPVYTHQKKPAKTPMSKITATPAPKKFKPNTNANKTMETDFDENSFWDDD